MKKAAKVFIPALTKANKLVHIDVIEDFLRKVHSKFGGRPIMTTAHEVYVEPDGKIIGQQVHVVDIAIEDDEVDNNALQEDVFILGIVAGQESIVFVRTSGEVVTITIGPGDEDTVVTLDPRQVTEVTATTIPTGWDMVEAAATPGAIPLPEHNQQ
jgi:hypothetical protein